MRAVRRPGRPVAATASSGRISMCSKTVADASGRTTSALALIWPLTTTAPGTGAPVRPSAAAACGQRRRQARTRATACTTGPARSCACRCAAQRGCLAAVLHVRGRRAGLHQRGGAPSGGMCVSVPYVSVSTLLQSPMSRDSPARAARAANVTREALSVKGSQGRAQAAAVGAAGPSAGRTKVGDLRAEAVRAVRRAGQQHVAAREVLRARGRRRVRGARSAAAATCPGSCGRVCLCAGPRVWRCARRHT